MTLIGLPQDAIGKWTPPSPMAVALLSAQDEGGPDHIAVLYQEFENSSQI